MKGREKTKTKEKKRRKKEWKKEENLDANNEKIDKWVLYKVIRRIDDLARRFKYIWHML